MSFTVIITFRNDEQGHRLRNLNMVLRWLSASPEVEVIVVEQDRLRRASFDQIHPNVRHAMVFNDSPFNKSWGFNVGARLSSSTHMCFCDADTLLGVPIQRVMSVATHGSAVIKPHRDVIDLTEEQTGQLAKAQSFDMLSEMRAVHSHQRAKNGEVSSLASALIVLTRTAFIGLGGWDERFLGWGGEDDGMSHKIQMARLFTLELAQYSAYHLWHPQPHENTFGQPAYKNNVALLQRYKRMTNAELDWLMAVQRQGHGNGNKYRPSEVF